jgi:hypothetical protein
MHNEVHSVSYTASFGNTFICARATTAPGIWARNQDVLASLTFALGNHLWVLSIQQKFLLHSTAISISQCPSSSSLPFHGRVASGLLSRHWSRRYMSLSSREVMDGSMSALVFNFSKLSTHLPLPLSSNLFLLQTTCLTKSVYPSLCHHFWMLWDN